MHDHPSVLPINMIEPGFGDPIAIARGSPIMQMPIAEPEFIDAVARKLKRGRMLVLAVAGVTRYFLEQASSLPADRFLREE